tara:strand:+ start:5917 stop:8112 length:2196 start_codon:yes stop_codon:yes gene_type:complete
VSDKEQTASANTDEMLDQKLHEIAVHLKRERLDEAREELAQLPANLQGDPRVVELGLRYLISAGNLQRAAGLAANYVSWHYFDPRLVELAMTILDQQGETAVALDLAQAAGDARNERVDRLAMKLARKSIDSILEQYEQQGPQALAQLTQPVMEIERHRRMVLRQVLLNSRNQTNLAPLAQALGYIVAAYPPAVEERIQLAAALRRLDRSEQAVEVCRAFPRSALDQPAVQQAQLLAFVAANDLSLAEPVIDRVLRRNTIEFPLLKLTVTALIRLGRPDEALELADRHNSDDTDPAMTELCAQTAFDAGDKIRAASIIKKAEEGGTATPALLALKGMIELDRQDREAAEAHMWNALTKSPDDLNTNIRLSELLLTRGAAKDAVPLLENAWRIAPSQRLIAILLARAHRMLENYAEAARWYNEAVKLSPGDVTLLRQAASANSQAGQTDLAEELFARSQNLRERKLPDTFEEGLAALDDQLHSANIPAGRFNWAWQFADKHAYPNRADWERRAKWGYLADQLLFDWLEVRTEDADQIMAHFVGLDELEAGLIAMREEKGGMFMASAHVGPLFAGPLSLELLEFKAKWLASTPSLGNAIYRDMLISTSDQTETAIIREVSSALADGYAIGIAVDGAPTMAAARIEFEGQEITYSSFSARMVYKHKLASCYAAPRWEGEKLRIELIRLPDPATGESAAEFAEKWREAYLDALRGELSGAPENLRMAGGIWRHIH